MAYRVVRCACGQEMRVPLETLHRYGKCVACQSKLKITEYNSRVEGEVETFNAPPPPRDGCARCGRAFQGDWDQVNTALGTLCLICGRQADVASPRRSAEESPQLPPETTTVAPIATARWSVIRPPKEKKPPPTRKELLIFGLVAAAFAAVVIFLPVEQYAAQFFTKPAKIDLAELAPWQRIVAWSADILAGVLSYAFTVTLALMMCDKLPSDYWVENVPTVLLAAVLLYFFGLAPLFIFVVILQFAVLFYMFDLDLFHVPLFLVASFIGGFAQSLIHGFVIASAVALF